MAAIDPALVKRVLLALSLFLAVCSGSVTSASPFEDGNKLYEQSQFGEALAKYQSAVQSHEWTANLFYNIGNTEYRLKSPGEAILNYERALALQPAHPEARRNLELVRGQTGAKLFPARWWQPVFPAWSPDVFSIMVAVAGWVAIFSGAFLWSKRTRNRTLWWGLALCGVLVAGYGKLALFADLRQQDLGIVTQTGAVARLAPADRAEVAQTLPEGSQVRILSERGAWVYCALPGKELGWLPAQSLARVRIRGA